MTIETKLNGITSPNPALPYGAKRDSAMTGGTVVKLRFKSLATYPAQQVDANMSGGTPFFDMKDPLRTAQISTQSGVYSYTAGGGMFGRAATNNGDGGTFGIRLTPSKDIGEFPRHEYMFLAWIKPLFLASDTQPRLVARQGGNIYTNATRSTPANQLALEQRGGLLDLYVAGQVVSGISSVPCPAVSGGTTLANGAPLLPTQVAFVVKPFATAGFTLIDAYQNGQYVSTFSLPAVEFAALAEADRKFEISNFFGNPVVNDRVRYFSHFYESWIENLTQSSRNSADLIATDYAENRTAFA